MTYQYRKIGRSVLTFLAIFQEGQNRSWPARLVRVSFSTKKPKNATCLLQYVSGRRRRSVVVHLTHSLPLARTDGLPVYVARAPRLHTTSDPTTHFAFVLQIRLTEFRGKISLFAKDDAVMKDYGEGYDKE
jgi:hypothetical protein